MAYENIKRSELLHFSQLAAREDVLVLTPEKRADIVESALSFLYRTSNKSEREELLALIQSIMKHDASLSNLFKETAYTVCNRHLVITFVNDVFLTRSKVEPKLTVEDVLGKSLYYEREYEGTQIEQMYSMVMETRMLADALVRYVGLGHDGWFVLVVIPLEEGGIGVLSRFSQKKEDIAGEIDPNSDEAPRFITLRNT